MSKILTLRKSNPLEIINVGDIIQINPDDGLIKKAIQEKIFEDNINTRLVIGICIATDNETPLNLIIDGGMSKTLDRILLDGGMSDTIQTIIIEGGDSTTNPRQIIQVAYDGEQIVNMCGPFDKKDFICISGVAGKGKSIKYIDIKFRDGLRKIGKVTEVIEECKQAKVKLNIE